MNLYVDGFVRWSAPQSRLSSGDRKDLRICTDPAHPGSTLGDACEGTPGWATLNLRAGITPLKGLRVDVGLLNILDTNYRIHGSGYDSPGINGKISVRYDFQ